MPDTLTPKQEQLLKSINSDPKAFVIRLTAQLTSLSDETKQLRAERDAQADELAKKDALITDMSRESRQKRSESQIEIQKAKAEAENIINSANQKASAIRRSANDELERAKTEAESIIATTMTRINAKIKLLEQQREDERNAAVDMFDRIIERYDSAIEELTITLSKLREKRSYLESYRGEIANESFQTFSVNEYVRNANGTVEHVADRTSQGASYQQPPQAQSFMSAFDNSGQQHDDQQYYDDGNGYSDNGYGQDMFANDFDGLDDLGGGTGAYQGDGGYQDVYQDDGYQSQGSYQDDGGQFGGDDFGDDDFDVDEQPQQLVMPKRRHRRGSAQSNGWQ